MTDADYTIVLIDGPARGRLIRIGTAERVRVLVPQTVTSDVESPESQTPQFATYDRDGHLVRLDDDPQPDWEKVKKMVGFPDYGVAFCISPWPDGGWKAGVQITDREWCEEQAARENPPLDPAMLKVPGDPASTQGEWPSWDIFDGFALGINAHGVNAAEAIDELWAKVHAL